MTVLSMLMQREERHDESAALNRQILALDPNNLVALNNLAWVLCEDKGKHEEALGYANRGIEVYPQYTDLLDTRGVIHYRLGQLEKAVADFTRCIDLSHNNDRIAATARFHLARTYAEMGRRTDAITEITQALERHDKAAEIQARELERKGVQLTGDEALGLLSPAEAQEARELKQKLEGQ
jgi:tetratricopeptide (TPR) repeat protein